MLPDKPLPSCSSPSSAPELLQHIPAVPWAQKQGWKSRESHFLVTGSPNFARAAAAAEPWVCPCANPSFYPSREQDPRAAGSCWNSGGCEQFQRQEQGLAALLVTAVSLQPAQGWPIPLQGLVSRQAASLNTDGPPRGKRAPGNSNLFPATSAIPFSWRAGGKLSPSHPHQGLLLAAFHSLKCFPKNYPFYLS